METQACSMRLSRVRGVMGQGLSTKGVVHWMQATTADEGTQKDTHFPLKEMGVIRLLLVETTKLYQH